MPAGIGSELQDISSYVDRTETTPGTGREVTNQEFDSEEAFNEAFMRNAGGPDPAFTQAAAGDPEPRQPQTVLRSTPMLDWQSSMQAAVAAQHGTASGVHGYDPADPFGASSASPIFQQRPEASAAAQFVPHVPSSSFALPRFTGSELDQRIEHWLRLGLKPDQALTRLQNEGQNVTLSEVEAVQRRLAGVAPSGPSNAGPSSGQPDHPSASATWDDPKIAGRDVGGEDGKIGKIKSWLKQGMKPYDVARQDGAEPGDFHKAEAMRRAIAIEYFQTSEARHRSKGLKPDAAKAKAIADTKSKFEVTEQTLYVWQKRIAQQPAAAGFENPDAGAPNHPDPSNAGPSSGQPYHPSASATWDDPKIAGQDVGGEHEKIRKIKSWVEQGVSPYDVARQDGAEPGDFRKAEAMRPAIAIEYFQTSMAHHRSKGLKPDVAKEQAIADTTSKFGVGRDSLRSWQKRIAQQPAAAGFENPDAGAPNHPDPSNAGPSSGQPYHPSASATDRDSPPVASSLRSPGNDGLRAAVQSAIPLSGLEWHPWNPANAR
jgi:hypothetical protein